MQGESMTPDEKAQAEKKAERLAELQAKQAAREAKRKAASDSLELEKAEILDKYEEELGPIGTAFALVDVREHGLGFVVLKRPAPSVHKHFLAAVDRAITQKKPIDDAAIDRYVTTCLLSPDPAAFRSMLAEVADLGHICARELRALHTIGEEAAKGKS